MEACPSGTKQRSVTSDTTELAKLVTNHWVKEHDSYAELYCALGVV